MDVVVGKTLNLLRQDVREARKRHKAGLNVSSEVRRVEALSKNLRRMLDARREMAHAFTSARHQRRTEARERGETDG